MGALGAFALLYDGEGRILLCHRRDADVWNLPGGQVEPTFRHGQLVDL